jgi:hypothetical protein
VDGSQEPCFVSRQAKVNFSRAIRADTGRVLAHGTSTLLVLPGPA